MRETIRRLRILPCLLILTAASSPAQVNSSEIPDGLPLQPAPDYSQWTITYKYAEDHAPKAAAPSGTPAASTPDFVLARPRTIVTVKTKRIIHESITDISQQQRENWYVGSIQYRKDTGSQVWDENQPDAHPDIHYSPLPASGFRDLDWISAATYTGKGSQDGKDCLIFKTKGKVTSLDSALPLGKEFEMVAYIDAKTRLPVEVDIDQETRTYLFAEPPEGMQALPDDLIQQIKAGNAGRAVMSQPADRPF